MKDAVVADPRHYKSVIENELVRVLKIEYRPYETGEMHSHPDSVLVCLTEMNGFMVYPDGRTEDMLVPAGAATFMPATTHQGGTRTANRFEAYLVELKDGATPSRVRGATLDAAVVDGHHYKIVVDNDRVRVLKIEYGPNESGAMHSHPDSVLVCLTELNGSMVYPDGRSEDMVIPAGIATFLPAITHRATSKTANRFEGYQIELKG